MVFILYLTLNFRISAKTQLKYLIRDLLSYPISYIRR